MADPAGRLRRRPARPLSWRRPARSLGRLRRACVLAAAAAAVAGCVSMPDSGPMGQFSASPQATAQHDYIGLVPKPPQAGWGPGQVVEGFLTASASYPVFSAIARQYLAGPASRSWNPSWQTTVFSTISLGAGPVKRLPHNGGKQTTVTYSGEVQARYGGTGQFVSPQTQDSPTRSYPFKLTQVNGQWRIVNPPSYRLLTVSQFGQFYKPQDLYFASQASQVLVPDSVFVPQGAPEALVLSNLVKALIPGQAQKVWLQDAINTLPQGTTFGGVTIDGTTAVVNLGGALASATAAVKQQVSAQLAWTLAGPPSGGPPGIQSIELVIKNQPWTPPQRICGVRQSRSYVQNPGIYSCYNPYPAALASFSFASNGQLWSRCGSEEQALQGSVGAVVPVFGPAASSQPPCAARFVSHQSSTVPSPVQAPSLAGTPSMVAVSPSRQFVACFSSGKKVLSVGPSGSIDSLARVPGTWSGVRALSWDRDNDLWVAEGGGITMVTPAGRTIPIAPPSENVTDLSVAPDGVRMAMIVQTGSESELELATIIHGSGPVPDGQRGSPVTASIGTAVQLGPNLGFPDAVTWYDADDLIVLNGAGPKKTVSEVPVDGQATSVTQNAPPGAISIAADSSMNALVVGLTHNRLDVSTGLEGPWQPLGVSGQNPTYPG